MNARNLICVCGAAAALFVTPAMAQQGTNPAPRPATPREPGAAQPATPSQPGQRDQDRDRRAGDAEVSSVLERLEGVWKVEVSMNDSMSKKPDDMKNKQPNEQDPARRDATTSRDDKTPAGLQTTTSKTFSGYAERKLVLGENILQETIVVPDMDMGMKDRQPTQTPSPDGNRADHDGFRGMSFISFDEGDQSYRIVFMDSKHNDMHVDAGTYDASRSRIVFHGKEGKHMDGSAKHNGTKSGTQSDPADFARQPARDKDMMPNGGKRFSDHGDVRVVVEIIGDDQHRVTMYKVSSDMDVTRPGEPRTGDPAASRPASTPGTQRDADKNNPDTMRDFPANAEAVVYRAVYTRASGAEANRYQQLIDNDRSLTRVNRSDR
jgi:hypothetical protein